MVRAIWGQYRSAYAGFSREIWVLAGALFINRCGSMVLPFMTLYLTSQHGMRESEAGRLLSVYGLGSVLGAYVGGRLIRHVGAVRLQTICLFASVPLYLTLPQWNTWWTIAGNLFCLSAVIEAVRPANATAVTYFSKSSERARTFGLMRLAANLGFSFGPAVGGVLAAISFRLLFWVDAATTCLGALLLLGYFRLKTTPQEQNQKRVRGAVVSPLQDRPFVSFLLMMLVADLVFFQIGSTYPLYLRDHFGLTKPQIGGMFAVNTVIIVVFEMLLIERVKHLRLLRTIGWGALLSCLGFGLLPFGVSGAYCVLCMVVLTLGEMLTFPLASSFVASRADCSSEKPDQEPAGEQESNAGMYMTWFTLVASCAAVLGPAIGATIYEHSPTWLWRIAIVVGVVALIGFRWLDHTVESRRQQATC